MPIRVQTLELRILRIKQQLVDIGELRPGVLSKQYNVCGNPNCRCKARPPQKHGPYFQLSWSRRGKSSTRFVRQQELPAVRRQIKNYQRLQSLMDQWIEASMALCEAMRPIIQNPRAKTHPITGERGTLKQGDSTWKK